MKSLFRPLLAALFLAGCTPAPPHALGTLERERISLPAPVSERIAQIPVAEGQAVAAGDTLLVLEDLRSGARLAAARADADRLRAALDEARTGPRRESITEARARLRGAEGVAVNARREFERTRSIVERKLLPPAELDRARAARESADASVSAAAAALAVLENGTRREQLAQAEAALAAATAQVSSLELDLARTRITAPRAGIVDSLPFEVGDEVPVGTPLAILLVGERPYARVYVPQPLRAGLAVGAPARIFVQGDAHAYAGRVRSLRSEASFTPYFALAGEDASRLSWLAEIELGEDAAALPNGLPLRAEFEPATP